MLMQEKIVIVGAGQSAAAAARALRAMGHQGPITLVGEETSPPYERPELSKSYLTGALPFEKLVCLDHETAETLGIELRLGQRVEAIDVQVGCLRLAEGASLAYDRLILATGGRARDLPGCLALRRREDADALREGLRPGGRLAVIGAGWLGLELAAMARAAGMEVDVHEMAGRVCARVLPPAVSEYLQARHAADGIRFHLGSAPDIAAIRANHDLTVACIGMDVNDELARVAGIACDGGIVVDDMQRSSQLGIHAIGDCAVQAGLGRVESWAYANASARRVAAAILGQDAPATDPLWFWSNQGSLLLQMQGRIDDDGVMVERATPAGGHGWFFLSREGALRAVIAIDMAREFAMARRWLGAAARLDAAVLADPSRPLKEAVRA